MDKEFIPYDLALALKELGFDEPCLAFKDFDHSLEIGDITKNSSWSSEIISIPLYQQAFDWFLKKYNMFAETTLWGDGIGYMSTIKEIRQENFREVYNLGSATPNRGLPNWDKNLENLACLNRMLEIVKSKGSLDTDKWRVLVNPLEREDFLLSISSILPDENNDTSGKGYSETYHTDHGTYEVIWKTDKEQPIVRKFIK
jgi:hypothetical protein